MRVRMSEAAFKGMVASKAALKVRPPVPLEKDVQAAIKAYLESRGWLVIRCNSGMRVSTYKGKRHVFRANSEPGCSDLICCTPSGMFVAIECKRPGQHCTLPQMQFQAKIRRIGLAFVATSIEDVKKELGLP